MKALLAICCVALTVASPQAFADGGDMQMDHPGRNDSFGEPGDRAKVSRTIAVDMTDAMRFIPSRITVKKGETIRFLVKNSGHQKHEMVLGTAKELREHARLMKDSPEMEHGDANELRLDPGNTGELVWQFTQAGNFDFACLQPGHFDAGMRGTIAVK